jgi:regulator of sigma E protease
MNWLTPTLILEFVLGLVLLIIIHELGHFLVAKWLKVGVDEFGIGFPPRITRLFTWAGTEFTVNWIPLGGFVRVKGEIDPDVPGGLAAASPWTRLFVYAAGPTANILASLVLFTLFFSQLGAVPDRSSTILIFVQEGSPAERAGLMAGDTILEADGQTVRSNDQLHDIIYAHLGESFEIVYLREGVQTTVTVTPRANPGPNEGALGIIISNPTVPFTFVGGISAAFDQMNRYISELGNLFGRLVRFQNMPEDAGVVGIIGMGDFYVEFRQTELEPGVPRLANSMLFFATISLSLGLLNLLPIPALDGGRILLTLPELVTGRRIPPRYEAWLNGASFLILILLLIYINMRDVVNIIAR